MFVTDTEIKSMSEKYDLLIEKKFGRVYINTKYEQFYFEENNKQKVKLMHLGRISSSKSDFHVQWYKNLTFEQICIYVSEHTRAKYSNQFIRFSI